MEDRTNRRGALKHLLRETAQGVRDAASPFVTSGTDGSRGSHVTTTARRPAPTQAGRPATRRVPLATLLEWADSGDLEERLDEVRRFARTSVRATPASDGDPPTGRSRIGGAPDFEPGREWPSWEGERLEFVAQFDLGALERPAGGELPGSGLMLLFYSPRSPSGRQPAHADGCRVIWQPGDEGGSHPAYEGSTASSPLHLSSELVLPRVWLAELRDLDLTDDERAGWEQLRTRLADAQGVETHDSGRGFLDLHRLFGYPDERRGDMPLACELLDRGFAVEDRRIRTHPRAAELHEPARRWRLLLQLSMGPDVPSGWDRTFERLYVWVDGERLARSDLSSVRALRR